MANAQVPRLTRFFSATKGSAPLMPALLYLVVVFVFPVAMLIGRSLTFGNEFPTLDQYTRLSNSPTYLRVLLTTLQSAALTSIIAIVLGYPVAYLLATTRRSVRSTLLILVLLPFWTSFIVRAFSWIVLLGRNGPVNQILTGIGITEMPQELVFNSFGAVVGMVHAMMPLSVITMLSVMEGIDTNLQRAASTLGASGSQIFWRVYFPLSMPGVASAGLLVFIVTMGFFIVPALLGGARETMIAQLIIFQIQTVLDWGFAGAISVLLLTVIIAIFLCYNAVFGLATISGGAGRQVVKSTALGRASGAIGKHFVAFMGNAFEKIESLVELGTFRRPDRPSWHIGQKVRWICGSLLLAFIALPAFFVIPVSFTEASYLAWPPRGFTLHWYQQVFASSDWVNAAVRSIVIAFATACSATLIGLPAAFALIRGRFRGKGPLMAILLLPMMVPSIITAVSLFYLYSKIGLVGTNVGLVMGHTILAIPYVVIAMMAVLKNYDIRFDQAAWTLGAPKLASLRLVTLPLLKGGLIAAFAFAFAISFDELTIALFVTGGQLRTLPRLLWDNATLTVTPELTAVATLLLVFISALILGLELVRRRSVQPR